MKTLPLAFDKDHFAYAQIDRSPTAAIYSQSQDGKVVAYEVVRIRVKAADEVMGRQVPEREVYPSSREWGTYGWTYSGHLAKEQAGATYAWLNGGREGERPDYADAVSRSTVAA